MDKHPCGGAVLQLTDKEQTADCRRNVDRPQSPVGALRSCGFVQVSNQHDSAPDVYKRQGIGFRPVYLP